MNPPHDANRYSTPPPLVDSQSSIAVPKQRRSLAASLEHLPYRRSNPSLSAIFASTANLTGSRPSSGTVTPTPSTIGGSPFSPGPQNVITSSSGTAPGRPHEPGILVRRAFVPHIAVLASADTQEMLQQKGFEGGFLQLIRPFGELIPGKVTIRDSTGASRIYEDYGVRFTGLRDGLRTPRTSLSGRRSTEVRSEPPSGIGAIQTPGLPGGGDVAQIEEVVDRHLSYAESQMTHSEQDYFDHEDVKANSFENQSPFHTLYLRRLLSGFPMEPHETFAHPVACVIAISSRSGNPIEELRRLYGSTNTGDLRLPQWVDNSYLRYYVLVHDEDHDDVAQSTSLYQQMTRHFGLHCHMLRLRSSQCVSSDDDVLRLPASEWLSASEELAEIRKRGTNISNTDPT